jgi:predicted NBD/HSP70 family sugar kinase
MQAVADPVATRRPTSRDLRHASRFAVLRGVYTLQTPTRKELAQLTGLSFATVSNVVSELLEVGMLVEAGQERSHGGRPRTRLRAAGDRGVLLGVDVAETYVHVDAFDTALRRLSRHQHPLSNRSEPDYVVAEIAGCVREAIVAHSAQKLLGVGVSMPGQVEPATGVSVFAPNWNWSDVPVRQMLADSVPVPVTVDNPLKATTVAELWFGHGRAVDDLVTVNLGTGVGAGIALGGELLRGITNNAGEWGHTTLVMDGRRCRCGRRGCVEAYVGVPGIIMTFREQYGRHRYIRDGQTDFVANLRAGLEAGDDEAHWLIDRVGSQLGTALADLVNLFNPERLVLTSWTATELGTWLLEPTRSRMNADAIAGSAAAAELVMSEIEENPVALGMATLTMESFLSHVGVPAGAGAARRQDF